MIGFFISRKSKWNRTFLGQNKDPYQKLLDPKRDSDKRLSNLRHIIDNAQEIADQQLLFCQFYSHIYFVFYENFLLVEQKLKAGHRDG